MAAQRVDLIARALLPPVETVTPARAVLGCIQTPTDYVLDKEGPRMLEELPGVEMRLQKMEFDDDKITSATYERAGVLGNLAANIVALRVLSEVRSNSCASFERSWQHLAGRRSAAARRTLHGSRDGLHITLLHARAGADRPAALRRLPQRQGHRHGAGAGRRDRCARRVSCRAADPVHRRDGR